MYRYTTALPVNTGLTCEQHTLGSRWGEKSGVAWEAPPPAACCEQASGWWFSPALGRPLGHDESSRARGAHVLELGSQEVIHVHAGGAAGVLLTLAEDVVRPAALLVEHAPAPPTRLCHDVGALRWLGIVRLTTVQKQTEQTRWTYIPIIKNKHTKTNKQG